MSEEEVKKDQQTEEVVNPEGEIVSALKDHPTRPPQEQIDAWKTQYDDVFVSGFSEEELYIWRAITREEYVNLQATAQQNGMNQFQMEEATCSVCVLWPENVEALLQKKGGSASTLSEQIMQHSNFLSPQAASFLVAKL